MKKSFITIRNFAMLLSTINLSTFGQALSETEPKLNKKSRTTGEPLPFAKVLNCRNINFQLNYNYPTAVNNKAIKEDIAPEFEAKEHTWARPVKGALARHKDYVIDMLNLDFSTIDTTKLYMPYRKLRIDSQSYVADGKVIDKKVLVDFMPPASDYASQPQDDKIVIEYMKLSSIKLFTCNGTEFKIVG